MQQYITAAGSELSVRPSGGWSADWDWFEERERCIDARPVEPDGQRLIVTVWCECCGEAEVIAQPQTNTD